VLADQPPPVEKSAARRRLLTLAARVAHSETGLRKWWQTDGQTKGRCRHRLKPLPITCGECLKRIKTVNERRL